MIPTEQKGFMESHGALLDLSPPFPPSLLPMQLLSGYFYTVVFNIHISL